MDTLLLKINQVISQEQEQKIHTEKKELIHSSQLQQSQSLNSRSCSSCEIRLYPQNDFLIKVKGYSCMLMELHLTAMRRRVL